MEAPLTWDYDHDGTYTCDEWKRYMNQLFVFADRNRDGLLSATEFASIRRAERTFANADFGYFDDNQDSRISRSEFVEKPSRFIGQYDRNMDCRVTAAELKDGTPGQKEPPGGGMGGAPGSGGTGGFSPKF
ncbi:EF-hand domain-containing protein [Bradyrhizobium betae]|uniref:EF-hand domain-containing protein n=1 Tax=Bradyrhizobium betae TaxID=244734 RepID=A0A4Q1UP14_9BRAD|nr:EF-hand domain-containing protein [Bradyrhizobium betae]RXT37942.1 hypothetical protein B5V03_31360 [Bradyrhizobium betae]